MHISLLLGVVAIAAVALGGPYTPDLFWPQTFPVGASSYSAVAIDTIRFEVHVAQRSLNYSNPILVYDKEGTFLRAWGNDTISRDGGWGVHGLTFQVINNTGYLWVTDTGDHTVKIYTQLGQLVRTLGTRGQAGSQLNPLQFGNVADADGADVMYVADGDGGVNNRVVALSDDQNVKFAIGGAAAGAKPGQFNSPHSVAYYPPANLIFVADRGNNRTQAFNSQTGKYVGEWTCTRPGTPWGLRTWTSQNLLFLADGHSQTVSILDLSAVTESSLGACNILAVVPVDKNNCTTPHEIAIDQGSGELYVACVGQISRVMRFHSECGNGRC